MMQQTLVPVLFLAAVALSSSNVLPILPDRLDPNAMYGQQNDNILSNRYSKAVHNNIIYTLPVGSSEKSRLMRKLAKYLIVNGDRTRESINEEDNYDDEGFRKEQWHNYPRQMDRLHEYLTHGNFKRNSDTDDPGIEYYDLTESKERNPGDTLTNEYLPDDNEVKNMCDSIVADTNPLLILKVHLACLRNRLKNTRSTKAGAKLFQAQLNNENETNGLEEKLFTNEVNPASKVKREDMTFQEDNSDENTPVKTKRLFSLWSRLKTLSHKGHELPHRRHIEFYGFPEAQGGGKLTAETRAMMRPPGSPLRWG